MQIKIFEGNGNNEDSINTWLKENPQIKVLKVDIAMLHERYMDGREGICNQWVATTVIYEC